MEFDRGSAMNPLGRLSIKDCPPTTPPSVHAYPNRDPLLNYLSEVFHAY